MHLLVTHTVETRLPTEFGIFKLHHFVDTKEAKEHLALIYGDIDPKGDVLVRLHSECFTGDVLGSKRCDCGSQLQKSLAQIVSHQSGVLIYLRQEGRGIGLAAKLQAYNLQDQGYDTVDANLILGHQADERDYGVAVAILSEFGIRSIQLLTNNPAKIAALQQLGIRVSQRVAVEPLVHSENEGYLRTKVERMSHLLNLPGRPNGSTAKGPVVDPIPRLPDAVQRQFAQLQSLLSASKRSATRTYVTVTYAQSLDGSIAGVQGQPMRLSGAESLTVTHGLRTIHDGILIGINTLLNDDPRLNTRLVPGGSPIPVIIDSQLRTPTEAKIFDHHPQVVIATLSERKRRVVSQDSAFRHREELLGKGARIVEVNANQFGGISLSALLLRLRDMHIDTLMVEGGATVLTSFLRERIADFGVVTIAPQFVGGRRMLVSSGEDGEAAADDALFPEFINPAYTPCGRDVLVWGNLRKASI